MMITPEKLAEGGSESDHQKALFCWAALPDVRKQYPELEFMFAIPNGSKRDKITAARLKAEGVKAGVLDIFLPVPRLRICEHPPFDPMIQGSAGLWIEMKVGDNKISAEQKKFIGFTGHWYKVKVCYSWVEARDAIIAYLGPRR